MSLQDDFYEVYDKPQIGSITVGFSGIDPAKLPTPQEVSDVDPSAIPHEQLKGLLGGSNSGHYHLTDYQLEKLNEYPSYDTLKDSIKHESLPDLQGGSSGEHYLLTGAEKEKLDSYPDYDELPDEISDKIIVKHETMPDLFGGDDNGHFHLTEEEIDNLRALIFELIPDGGGDIIIPSGIKSHELLSGLYGGNAGGHYHFTNDEWRKLRKLIEVLFPDGADEPVFPNVPDTPSDPEHGDADWTGLPTGTPPAWGINSFPNNYSAWPERTRMYYGGLPESTSNNAIASGIIVPMMYNSSTSNMYIMKTSDLSNWNKQYNMSTTSYGTHIDDYMYADTGQSNQMRHRVYIMMTVNSQKSIRWLYGNSSWNGTSTSSSGISSFTACCYSPQLDIRIFVGQNGTVVRMKDSFSLFSGAAISTGLSSVNPSCAEWLPEQQLFCVAGPQGTSTSATGAAGTWTTHTGAPHNLQDLTYREDLGVLLAWREEDRQFYVSADGVNWQAKHKLPSTEQISKIAAVDYNPDLEWYCAIGGTSKYAYFSKDLEHWVATTVSNGAAIPMGSVIWMANTKKYVLMPTSGTYFYTFSPADWRDA